jgi:HEAT repeat protein
VGFTVADPAQKAAKLVKRNRWGKINKLLEKGDSEIRAALASELKNNRDDNSINLLIILLKDSDEKVQLEAVKSLGELRVERAKTHLQNMFKFVPEDKTELIEAIKDAIAKINEAIHDNQ